MDSRNCTTLEKAITAGADIVNDVTGLTDPKILELVSESQCQVVAMHSVSIPADPKKTLPSN